MKNAPIMLRALDASETGMSIVYGALDACQEFGKNFLKKDLHLVTDNNGFPDIRRRISDSGLDIIGYHCDLQNYYEAHPREDIFSLQVVGCPITANEKQVCASSWKHIDLKTGKIVRPNTFSVVMSKDPLFLKDDSYDAIEARAYLLGWHELGHITREEQQEVDGHCADQGCIMSRPGTPEKRQSALDDKVSTFMVTKRFPICANCENRLNEFYNTHIAEQ